jgi:hypothetical protein
LGTQNQPEAYVPLLEDLLLRFRRVWAPPGPVEGQAGVPTDLQGKLDDELRELTVELSSIDQDGQAIVQAAESEGAAIVAAARAESVRRMEAARARLPEIRAKSAATRIRDRQAQIDELIAKAESDAEGIRSRARSHMQPFVDRVAADVLAGLDAASEEQHARVMGGR